LRDLESDNLHYSEGNWALAIGVCSGWFFLLTL